MGTVETIDIEYEQVTVKMPKDVMNFLRSAASITGDTPERDIEIIVKAWFYGGVQ